jgi:hypothetical protein
VCRWPAHSDGITKLIQMIEARNPDNASPSVSSTSAFGGSATPVKMCGLEMYECTVLGQDVLEWLRSRIDNVECVDPLFEQCNYLLYVTGHEYALIVPTSLALHA